jgi:hypothetical protein
VRIVGVEEGGTAVQFGEEWPDDPRIYSGPPGSEPNGYSGRLKPRRELAPPTSDDDLRGSQTGELPGQEPDLPLSSPPLSSGGDVDNPHSCAWKRIARERG